MGVVEPALAARMHINILELRAVYKTCHVFLPAIGYHHTLVMSDNTMTILHQQTRGHEILNAVYGSGTPMKIVHCTSYPFVGCLCARYPECDCLCSQQELRNRPRMGVTYTVVADIFGHWGTPIWDFFASHTKTKCTQYSSREGLGAHSQGDAVVIDWSDRTNCAFRSYHVSSTNSWERVTVILIAPFWLYQFWFLFLLCMSKFPLLLFQKFLKLSQHNGRGKHLDPLTLHLIPWFLDGYLC